MFDCTSDVRTYIRFLRGLHEFNSGEVNCGELTIHIHPSDTSQVLAEYSLHLDAHQFIAGHMRVRNTVCEPPHPDSLEVPS
jgi:hypothetical protein